MAKKGFEKNSILVKSPINFTLKNIEVIAKQVFQGKVGVLPTDTIYGIVGSALNAKAVKKIYKIKKRDKRKPFIILISKITDLKLFGIKLNKKQKIFINKYWPGKVSIIFSNRNKKFEYLHRKTNSLAFRFPKHKLLHRLLEFTGPIVAPSANLQGKDTVKNANQAKKIFKDSLDFYVRGKITSNSASTLVKYTKNLPQVLRQGDIKIKNV